MIIMNKIVEVLADKSDLVKRAQEIVLSRLQAAIEARNKFTIALAGGSTPKNLFTNL